ncbi:hypothetical protein IWW47_006167, partial [Coemansia sp. RSA 2052]
MADSCTSSPELLSKRAFHADDAADIAAHHYSETADFQRLRASHDEAITQGVSKVLVIYTGGTIGMKHDKANGYSPAKGYLPEELRSNTRFHDADGFNDFDIQFQRSSAINNPSHQPKDASTGMPRARQAPANTSTLIEMAKRRLQDMSRGQKRGPWAAGDLVGLHSDRARTPEVEPSSVITEPHRSSDSTDEHAQASDSAIVTESQSGCQSPGPCASDRCTASSVERSDVPTDAGTDNEPACDTKKVCGADTPSRLSEWLITPKS